MSRGGAASGQKGTAYERELVQAFRAAGWGALRLPSSGSATDRELPDVLAGEPFMLSNDPSRRATSLWAIEAKSGKSTTLYVDEQEVEALRAYAGRWGARAFISGRFTTQGTSTAHYLLDPDDARITDGGRYGIPQADAAERAYATIDPDGRLEVVG